MPYNTAIEHSNKRYRERLGRTQCLYDELLGVIADFEGHERGDGHLGYRFDINGQFGPDNDLWIHVVHVPLVAGQ